MNPNPDEFVTFQLYRREDESGVSGTGTVAVGCKFPEPNGKVVLAWLTEENSVAVYDSIESVEKIHGHNGRSVVVQMDATDFGEQS